MRPKRREGKAFPQNRAKSHYILMESSFKMFGIFSFLWAVVKDKGVLRLNFLFPNEQDHLRMNVAPVIK